MIKFKVIDGVERIAFAEVILPDTLNVFGDFHTKESVRQFAYGFMINGFGIDKDHDNIDISPGVRIVESFLAHDTDDRFTPGAWVVGIHVLEDRIWSDILSGEINGFSYEALVTSLKVDINVIDVRQVYGVTFPDPEDGHTHVFWVSLNEDGRVTAGGTSVDDGHSHTITRATYTNFDDAGTHRHRYAILRAIEDMTDEAA